MGIYYFAVDYSLKQQIWSPLSFSYKCIYHPEHPLPQMIAMKNCQGYNFKIITDTDAYSECEFKDITDEVYAELKCTFPDFDWQAYES